MNLAQLCKEIKSLIREILIADQELEEAAEQATKTSESKAREAVTLLTEYLKEEEIAALYLKYNKVNSNINPHILNFNQHRVVWDINHGLGIQPIAFSRTRRRSRINPDVAEPLVMTQGNFPIEELVKTIHTQLKTTLNKIKNQNNDTTQKANERIRELDKLINCLKEID